jgi:hypothetical protein
VTTLRAIELTLVGGVGGLEPCLIFTGKVFGEQLVLRHDRVFEEMLAVVVDAHHLGATLQEGGDDESEDEDYDHRASE